MTETPAARVVIDEYREMHPMFRYPLPAFVSPPLDELPALIVETVRAVVEDRHGQLGELHDTLMTEREQLTRQLAELDDRIDATRHEIARAGMWLSEHQS